MPCPCSGNRGGAGYLRLGMERGRVKSIGPQTGAGQRDLGQKLPKRLACGRLELRSTNRAIVVWISSLKPLFDERKVLPFAQRAVVVGISRGELLLRQAAFQLIETKGAVLVG